MNMMSTHTGQMSPYIPFTIGHGSTSGNVELNLTRVSNPHILVIGSSGSGKSHTIRNTAARLHQRGLTLHVIELHPDMAHENFIAAGCGDLVTQDAFNYLNFDYVEGDSAINPLAFSPHPKSGGVYMAIQDFIEVARLFNSSLGSRQVSYLQKLLEYTYEKKGIEHSNPASWTDSSNPRNSTAHHPSLYDVLESLAEVRRSVVSGLSLDALEDVNKLKAQCLKIRRVIKSGALSEEEASKKEDELSEKFEQLKMKLENGLGDEIYSERGAEPFYRGWKAETLDSLADTLRSMIESTLFTRGIDSPEGVKGPKKGKINVYRLSNLAYVHQKTMIHVLLRRIYNASMRMCKQLDPDAPDTYVILDEGRYAKEAAKEPMSPLNVIMGGSRKFGLGAIIGAQGADQVSADMAQNFAIKFILASEPSSYADAKKYFNLPPARMKKITPRQDALVSISSSPFELTRLFPKGLVA